jgi:hypothetical protein
MSYQKASQQPLLRGLSLPVTSHRKRWVLLGTFLVAFVPGAAQGNPLVCMYGDGQYGFLWSLDYSQNRVKVDSIDRAENVIPGSTGWRSAHFGANQIVVEFTIAGGPTRYTLNKSSAVMKVEHSSGSYFTHRCREQGPAIK